MVRVTAVLLAAALLAAGATADSKHLAVDRIFGEFNTHTPGCAVGVSLNGKVELRTGYGMADLERNVPITADTVFESGSVAKQFTAATLHLLARQGKLSLDDPLRKYLPELPDYGAPVTIRQVLSHISGLREWRPLALLSGIPEDSSVIDNRDLLRLAAMQRSLNFDPGTAYSYSNTGYNILTILVERALSNGQTFQDFTRQAIFEPLGMTHTRWRDNFRAVVPNRALAYEPVVGGWGQKTPIQNIIGAGGMLTTVEDWLKWNGNFTHAKVGGPEFLRDIQSPAVLKSGKTIGYAAGLTIQTVDGLREVSHGGATGGYRTWLGRYPEQGVSVAVMCNAANAVTADLGRRTARVWTGAAPATPAIVPMDPEKLQQLTGLYRKRRDGTVVELKSKDGKLLMGGTALTPAGEGSFVAGESKVLFTGSQFRVDTSVSSVEYERVERAQPTTAELAPLAGEYKSTEASARLMVSVSGGRLMLAVMPGAPRPLRPTYRDGFAMEGNMAVRFLRDNTGKVTALSVGDDRVWDMRFERIR